LLPLSKMDVNALDAELTAVLHGRGQRVTPQRLILHRLLRAGAQHLTAEDLLGRSRAQLPNVSLPTVYATLDLFEQLGVIRRVPGTGPAQVYDSRTDRHHHLRCVRCGRVSDLEADIDLGAAARAAERQGFAPERIDVAVSGVCAACAERAPAA
jgi:Fur family transcriptional regulator, stress-responsive regulator